MFAIKGHAGSRSRLFFSPVPVFQRPVCGTGVAAPSDNSTQRPSIANKEPTNAKSPGPPSRPPPPRGRLVATYPEHSLPVFELDRAFADEPHQYAPGDLTRCQWEGSSRPRVNRNSNVPGCGFLIRITGPVKFDAASDLKFQQQFMTLTAKEGILLEPIDLPSGETGFLLFVPTSDPSKHPRIYQVQVKDPSNPDPSLIYNQVRKSRD